MMARAKRIYTLIIKFNKLFSFFSVAVFSKRNTKHVLHESLGELEKAVATAFSRENERTAFVIEGC